MAYKEIRVCRRCKQGFSLDNFAFREGYYTHQCRNCDRDLARLRYTQDEKYKNVRIEWARNNRLSVKMSIFRSRQKKKIQQ